MQKMLRNALLLSTVIVVILLGIWFALDMFQHRGTGSTTTAAESTKLAFYNNGTTWLHLDMVMENVTLKNGGIQTFYAKLFMKPDNGTIVIDLSQLAGYGNEKLPSGTTIRIKAWKGLFGSVSNGTGDLNLNMQGWSNTLQPQTGDIEYNIWYPGLSMFQLPANITADTLIIKTDKAEFDGLYPGITDDQTPLYEEEILTVGQDGEVTITTVQVPELCKLMAHV